MTILAIDTSEQACSVALASGDTVIDSASEMIGRGHAERLLPLIEERLAEAGLSYADLTRVAVTTGPGTFTGLRIGLAVARGLALQADIPCVGLTGLMVLAAQALGTSSGMAHSLITGRGGQAFYQAFEGAGDADSGSVPRPIHDPKGLDAEDIADTLRATDGVVVGSGVDLLAEKNLFGSELGETLTLHPDRTINPAMLARLAAEVDPAQYPPEPTYFRAADAKKATPVLPVAQNGSR